MLGFASSTRTNSHPHWRDLILFYEYFHGDNGAGLGASHQTGWTGCIAALQDFFGRITAADLLTGKKGRLIDELVQQQVYGKAAREKSTKKTAKTKTAKVGTR
jgi:hypothetical protein